MNYYLLIKIECKQTCRYGKERNEYWLKIGLVGLGSLHSDTSYRSTGCGRI